MAVPSRSRRRRHLTGWLSTLVATCFLLAACGAHRQPTAAAPTSTTPGVTPTSLGATTTTAAPTSPSTAGTTIAASYVWQQAAGAALDLGGGASSTLAAVLAPPAPGDVWLIVGTRVASGGSTTATVWSSSDAKHWRAVSLPGSDSQALAATQWGARTVVVGSTGSGAGRRAAVWISPGAGLPFTAVIDPSAFAATPASPPGTTTDVIGGATMDVVGAGTAGVFAVGSSSGRPAMWYSTNGTDWQRVPGAERLLDGDRAAHVTSILVTPSGVYVGGTVQAGTAVDGTLWISNDGINWRQFKSTDNPFAGPGDHVIEGLAESGGSLVAVGAVRSGPTWTPAAWISPDGTSWTEADEALPAAGTGRGASAEAGNVALDVVATPSGLDAVGGSGTANQLWTSSNGSEWTDLPFPTSTAGTSGWSADLVASNGYTTIVVDREVGQPRVLVDTPAGWGDLTAHTSIFGHPRPIATPAALVRLAGRLLLVVDVVRPAWAVAAPGQPSVAVLASTDGSHWRVLTRGATLRGATVEGVTVSSGRLVAVGELRSGSGRSSPMAAAWTSPDGRRWVKAAVLGGMASSPSPAGAGGTSPGGPVTARTTAVGTVAGRPVAAGWTAGGGGPGTVTRPSVWSASPAGWDERSLAPTAPLDSRYPLAACSNGKQLVVVGTATRSVAPPPPPGSTPSSTNPSSTTTTSTTTPVTTTVPFTGNPSGTAGQGDDGTVAATWSTTDGQAWTTGAVSPITGVGANVRMLGCVATTTGFVAYGQVPGRYGQDVPAIWSSPDGTTWTLEVIPSLQSAESAPFTDLDVAGSTYNAVSGGAMPADPTASVGDPIIPAGEPAAATGPDGEAGVWQSTDDGATWAQIATTGPVWGAAQTLSTDELTTLGGRLIVVGQVDGRLAVWSGSPTSASSS